MNEHNRRETGKLCRGAKWVIRQLLFEVETRQTNIDCYDAQEGGSVIFWRLVSGDEAVVEEFAQKLNIKKEGSRLEVHDGQ